MARRRTNDSAWSSPAPPAFAEHRGEVWGCHIGWSGNYEIVCDSVTDGRRSLQVGELLASGEITLAAGGSTTTRRRCTPPTPPQD